MSSDLARPIFLLDRPLLLGGALVLLVALVALACRPLMPVDETRYLAVAWEMWREHEFLVPHLLGEPYHHKPPLLFWLIHAGWVVFGPVEWWARLVPGLCALACLGLTVHLARVLWPAQRMAPTITAFLLVGCPFWLAFATVVMFDGLLAACILIGVLGLVRARQDWRGWLLVGLGIGLGVLAKGPVVLLHLLPPALLAPWWLGGARSWWRWYLGLLAALLGGAAIGLAWALPAAAHGGDDYGRALLWGQSVARITGGAELNTHAHGWWWYLPFVPALLFPWVLWPPCWRAGATLRHAIADQGVRLLLSWLIPTFAMLCLISGKQVHYLVPLLPALALLMARGLSALGDPGKRVGQAGVAGVLGFIGVVLTLGPHVDPAWIEFLQVHHYEFSPHLWAALIPWWCGPAVLAAAAWAWWLPLAGLPTRSGGTAAACVALALIIHVAVGPAMGRTHDTVPIATIIADWRRQGMMVVKVVPYAGEYEFAGRLSEPLRVTWREDIRAFAAQHPHGRLLLTFSARLPPPPGLGEPLWTRPWRGVTLGAWDTAAITAQQPR